MQRLRLRVNLLLLLSFMGICLIGCGRALPKVEDVKGKWVAIKKEAYTLGGGQQVGFTIEFLDDKTIMMPSGKGTWSILNDGRLKIDILGMTMHGALEKGLLIITMPDQKGKVIVKKQ
ncbi:MAG: hypothetical protein ACYDIC_15590 [Desulfobaccales bacterium]